MTLRNRSAALALVPLLGILWGFNWPAVRIGLNEIPPWTLRAIGMLLAGMFLVVVALLMQRSLRIPRQHWWRVLVVGTLSIAAFNVLLAFAQLASATSRAAVVTFTMPIWAVLLARFVLNEPLDRARILGLALGLAGLVCLGWPLLVRGELSVGLLFALLGGMAWAAGTVLLKRFPIDAAPLAITAWQLLIGASAATAGAALFEGVHAPHTLSWPTVMALLYHVLFAQALAYYIWFEVVPQLPAGAASLGTLMVPAVGTLGAVIFLGERPTGPDLLGLVLVVGAAATILLPARPVRSKD